MSPRASFAHRLRWLIPPRGKEKPVVVLQAYFDESGIHSDSPICVIAGFSGSTRHWQRFEALYRKEVGPDEEMPGMHAKDFFSNWHRQVELYKGWSGKRNLRLLNGLVQAIQKGRLTPVGAAIDTRAFLAYSSEQRCHLTGGQLVRGKWRISGSPFEPYYVPFQWAIIEGLRRVKTPGWSMNFVFDQQRSLAPFALTWYNHIRESPENRQWCERMGSLDFTSREKATPLQAADLLSYCWYQLLLRGKDQLHVAMRYVLNNWTRKNDEIQFFSQSVMDQLLSLAPMQRGHVHRI